MPRDEVVWISIESTIIYHILTKHTQYSFFLQQHAIICHLQMPCNHVPPANVSPHARFPHDIRPDLRGKNTQITPRLLSYFCNKDNILCNFFAAEHSTGPSHLMQLRCHCIFPMRHGGGIMTFTQYRIVSPHSIIPHMSHNCLAGLMAQSAPPPPPVRGHECMAPRAGDLKPENLILVGSHGRVPLGTWPLCVVIGATLPGISRSPERPCFGGHSRDFLGQSAIPLPQKLSRRNLPWTGGAKKTIKR